MTSVCRSSLETVATSSGRYAIQVNPLGDVQERYPQYVAVDVKEQVPALVKFLTVLVLCIAQFQVQRVRIRVIPNFHHIPP